MASSKDYWLYTFTEAGSLWGVCRHTVSKYVRQGRVETVPTPGGKRIPHSEIERVAREGFHTSGSSAAA